MRRFLLAAATLLAAAPVSAQTSMTAPEREAFRADWENWSRCAAAANVYSAYSKDPAVKAEYDRIAEQAHIAGEALAVETGADEAFAQLSAATSLLMATDEFAESPALIAPQLERCVAAGIFPAPATPAPQPAPQTAAVPAASVPLGYTIALSVNGRGGAVTYARTNVPGQLAGRWSLIDGSIKGEETATRTGGAAADGSLAGTYATSGISNGSRYTGRLSMTARGTAAGGAIRLYDLAWDNGDRGFGVEEGPWLHIVYGAAATGLITPSRDGGGWELIWVGPEGEGIAAGKVFWRGSLTGTHMADDPDAGTSFPIEVTETAPGTLRVILPGGFAGIALKAG